jgi:putative ABC transport system substrate-binding protein
VIVAAGGTASVWAAKAATTTVPIVFLVNEDPVKLGLVTNLARPGSNLTGINFFNAELVPKRLALLRELIPGAARIVVLVDPADAASTEATLRDVEPAARAMGLQILVYKATTIHEIDAAFTSLVPERPDALFIAPTSFFFSRRSQLVNLASRYAVPATYSTRDYTEIGGLMSYGTSFPDTYRHLGAYVGRVLKGAKPADLPVMQSTKFEFVINLSTARMLGLTVPPSLLALADEVIE